MASKVLTDAEVKAKKIELEKKIALLRDRDREKVKGIFRYFELPGGTLEFVFSKWGDPVTKYKLKDGDVYSIPIGVAKHLNSNCWYPLKKHSFDANGIYMNVVSQKKNRTAFQSLEFVDIDDVPTQVNQIVTVSAI